MSSKLLGSWIRTLVVISWLAVTPVTEAGQIFVFHSIPSVDLIPSSRDTVSVFFLEDDWGDTCRPELSSFSVDDFEIMIRFEVDSGCVPEPDDTFYAGTARVGRLPVGNYSVVVEAPDFTTREFEETRDTFEVVEPVQCGMTREAAATVLVPYFEVDLENPGGRTTLFSVGSVRRAPVLAHAVVWTNWGNPVFSFDFFVPADGIVSFNLRDILSGQLVETIPPSESPEGFYESCTDPVTNPKVDALELRALLTGQPHLDGLCYSSPVEEGQLATGYVTVDVVRDCSGAELSSPSDPEYFLEGGTGLATNDNALIGDFALVDPSNDFAQGERLVSLVADAARFGSPSFYGQEDNRMPLPVALRSRFLNGGVFTGGTELLVWIEGRSEPIECGETHSAREYFLETETRSESGGQPQDLLVATDQQAFRLEVGGDRFPIEPGFGSVDIGGLLAQSFTGPPSFHLLQTWIMPVVSADNRFSIGLEGFPIEDFCR